MQDRRWDRPRRCAYANIYAKYLGDFAYPHIVFLEDVLAHNNSNELKAHLRGRIDGDGCPILAWSTHLITEEEFTVAGRELLKVADRADISSVVRTKVIQSGLSGYILYVDDPNSMKSSQPEAPRTLPLPSPKASSPN